MIVCLIAVGSSNSERIWGFEFSFMHVGMLKKRFPRVRYGLYLMRCSWVGRAVLLGLRERGDVCGREQLNGSGGICTCRICTSLDRKHSTLDQRYMSSNSVSAYTLRYVRAVY